MRASNFFAVLPALPLALAACGAENDVDERVVSTGPERGVEVDLPTVPVKYPEVPLDARNTVDYEGAYEQRRSDGRIDRITLEPDDRYTIRDQNGAERSGSFNWYADNSRILIRDAGEDRVYAIADGALYRMEDETAPLDSPRTEARTYRRVAR